MYHIRYTVARPARPVDPTVLKNGKISVSKAQDTTSIRYVDLCKSLEQEVNKDYLSYLRARDANAWSYTLDIPVEPGEAESVAANFPWAAKRMRNIRRAPERNPWACHSNYCDWLDLCHADASGDVDNWWGVGQSDYTGHKSYKLKAAPHRGKEGYPIGKYNKVLEKSKNGVVVTPSEMRCFFTCPRKWWFEYAKQKRVMCNYDKFSPRLRGILCHSAAERYGNGNESFDEFADESNAYLLSQGVTQPETWDEDLLLYWDTGRSMFLDATIDMDEILYIETRFGFVLPETKTWVTCQPDIVCRKGNDIYVIDYKTSSSKQLNNVADRYRINPSMYLYVLALERGFVLEETANV